MKIYFLLISLLLVFSSCYNLKFVPIKTPIEIEKERKTQISIQLANDFSKTKLAYNSIYFAKSELLKPISHFKLDSLYAIKYQLDQSNLKDEKLEKEIKKQQLIVANDSTSSYFIEKHVFSIQDSIKNNEVFFSKLVVNKKNQIETVEILESAKIPYSLNIQFACFANEESFIYPHENADPAEIEFYALYKNKLAELEGVDKDEFLIFTLSVMKIAKQISSLDKELLIQEFVRTYVQGNQKNMLDEKFIKMEEFFGDQNELLFYKVEYQCIKKMNQNDVKPQQFDVYLDPFLQLIEIKNK